MNLPKSLALTACGMLLVCTGCTSTSPVTRAQSIGEGWQTTPASHRYSVGEQRHERIYDGMHGTEETYHSATGYPTFPANHRAERRAARAHGGEYILADGTPAPEHWASGYAVDPGTPCPHGYYDFTPGGCPYCGADHIRWKPRHHHTYSYHRPRDLVYPPPNVPGGAVVYPYYTHKGPSDFFRDE